MLLNARRIGVQPGWNALCAIAIAHRLARAGHLTHYSSTASYWLSRQDIDEAMGPTVFLPRTHTSEAHAIFDDREGAGHWWLLEGSPQSLGVIQSGDVTLFDSRLLHCGAANTTPRRRIIFYFSFKAAAACPPVGTLLPGLRGLRLADLHEGRQVV